MTTILTIITSKFIKGKQINFKFKFNTFQIEKLTRLKNLIKMSRTTLGKFTRIINNSNFSNIPMKMLFTYKGNTSKMFIHDIQPASNCCQSNTGQTEASKERCERCPNKTCASTKKKKKKGFFGGLFGETKKSKEKPPIESCRLRQNGKNTVILSKLYVTLCITKKKKQKTQISSRLFNQTLSSWCSFRGNRMRRTQRKQK